VDKAQLVLLPGDGRLLPFANAGRVLVEDDLEIDQAFGSALILSASVSGQGSGFTRLR